MNKLNKKIELFYRYAGVQNYSNFKLNVGSNLRNYKFLRDGKLSHFVWEAKFADWNFISDFSIKIKTISFRKSKLKLNLNQSTWNQRQRRKVIFFSICLSTEKCGLYELIQLTTECVCVGLCVIFYVFCSSSPQVVCIFIYSKLMLFSII